MSSFLSIIIICFVKFIMAPLGAQKKLKTLRKALISLRKYMLALYEPGNPKLGLRGNFESDTVEWGASLAWR